MTEQIVVGAALYDDGRLLAARRSAPPELAGRWELPGGKVEPGERPEEALMRELREELGVDAEPVARVPGEWPLKPGYVMWVWTAKLLSGDPEPLEDHDALRWLAPDEVWSVPWLDADVPAVAAAIECHVGGPGPAGPGPGAAGPPGSGVAGPGQMPSAGGACEVRSART